MRPVSPRSLLRHAETPAFLVVHPVNIRYLTGVEVSAGAVLVTQRAVLLFVDPRYREVASGCARGCSVRDLADLPAAIGRQKFCGFEGESVTVAQRDFWKRTYRGTAFRARRGVVMHFRRSKDAAELRTFRRAQRITQDILHHIPTWLRPGVSERELAWKVRLAASRAGTDTLAFDPIVAFGPHTSHPHHRPTARPLKKGDIVQVDIGARYDGYCADQSRVFFTGRPTPAQERALTAVREAKETAERQVRTSASTHALDRTAREVLRRYGMEDAFVHSLGHGVGLEIHEGVTLSQKRPEEHLVRHEIITIEPGVYFPGKFGIRLEDERIVA